MKKAVKKKKAGGKKKAAPTTRARKITHGISGKPLVKGAKLPPTATRDPKLIINPSDQAREALQSIDNLELRLIVDNEWKELQAQVTQIGDHTIGRSTEIARAIVDLEEKVAQFAPSEERMNQLQEQHLDLLGTIGQLKTQFAGMEELMVDLGQVLAVMNTRLGEQHERIAESELRLHRVDMLRAQNTELLTHQTEVDEQLGALDVLAAALRTEMITDRAIVAILHGRVQALEGAPDDRDHLRDLRHATDEKDRT